MKIFVCIVGAIAFGVICFIAFSLISQYQVSQIGYTHTQSDKLTDIFVLVTPVVMFAGGWISLNAYRNFLRKKQRA